MYSLKIFLSALLVIAVNAQNGYNYQKPQAPPGEYLPPSNAPPPSTRAPPAFRPPPTGPTQSQTDNDSDALPPPSSGSSSDSGSDGAHEPGMPFDFNYAVKDDSGNDFSHQAESDGEVVKGEYRVQLPDGRLQIVKYTADWKNGYNAEVTYEGEAQYPEPAPPTPQQPSGNGNGNGRPNNGGSNNGGGRPNNGGHGGPPPFNPSSNQDIDSQGLQPSTQPSGGGYRPQPTQPPTTRQPPNGLYGAPNVPFGVRNSPKFGYNKRSSIF